MKDEDKTKEQLITELAELRQRAEGALRESEERFRSLVESTSDWVWEVDINGVYTYASPKVRDILGYEQEEVIGITPFDLMPPPEKERVGAIFRDIVASQRPFERLENNNLHKDGRLIVLETSGVPIFDASGDMVGYRGIDRDITERKKAEEELQNTNRRLSETLAELQTTQQQIIQQERLRALGQMASGIVHDFNNVLTPILGYSELMLMAEEVLSDKERAKNYLGLMNIAAKDASNIVRRLREFYRQREYGELFSSVNLNQLVQQAIELTQPRWKDQSQAKGITISIENDWQEVPLILGNESELRELLTNLIFNAVDAMKENGTITIRTRFDGGSVLIEVSDTGIGMTDEVKQRCFEPFFSTKEEQGTGLGLSIVHGIIRRHYGTIEIKSKIDEGTTVTIRFPIQAQSEGEEQEAEGNIRSLHVLVVDDEQMVRDLITQYLLALGHTVDTANNGREGILKFYKSSFDLVITDMAMPDMSGVQLAALIKQVAPNKPVILLTGFGDMMRVTGDIPLEVDYLLNKPVTLIEFREALTKVIVE